MNHYLMKYDVKAAAHHQWFESSHWKRNGGQPTIHLNFHLLITQNGKLLCTQEL